MLTRTIFAIVLLAFSAAAAEEPKARVLFDFSETEAGRQWQTVNDGVMGGRSDRRLRVVRKRDDGVLRHIVARKQWRVCFSSITGEKT